MDPQDVPDFTLTDLRRVTTVDGEEMILVIDQDGDTFLVNAEDYDNAQPPGSYIHDEWQYADWPEAEAANSSKHMGEMVVTLGPIFDSYSTEDEVDAVIGMTEWIEEDIWRNR